jgi:hypothetical protein
VINPEASQVHVRIPGYLGTQQASKLRTARPELHSFILSHGSFFQASTVSGAWQHLQQLRSSKCWRRAIAPTSNPKLPANGRLLCFLRSPSAHSVGLVNLNRSVAAVSLVGRSASAARATKHAPKLNATYIVSTTHGPDRLHDMSLLPWFPQYIPSIGSPAGSDGVQAGCCG